MVPTNTLQEQSDAAVHGSPWYLKFFDSFFAAASILITINYLMASLPEALINAIYASPFLSYLYRHSFWLFGLLFGAGYSLYWHHKEKAGHFPTTKRQALFRTILRYCLCFLVVQYGFLKLLGVQFYLGINWRDMPVDELNGFFLTWYYFGYSRPFAILLGLLEITGAVLLLYRRTTLLGAFVLVPVMLNVLFINFFYKIAVVLPALFMAIGILYLCLLHWDMLRQLFAHAGDRLPKFGNKAINNSFRFVVILLAFLTQVQWLTPLRKERTDAVLEGKWKVEQQLINGYTVPPDAWQKDTSASIWSNLYLEDGWFTTSTHPYYFDPKKSRFAAYTYDSSKQVLEVKWQGEKGKEETTRFRIDAVKGDKMSISGIVQGDTVLLNLNRVKPVKAHRPFINW